MVLSRAGEEMDEQPRPTRVWTRLLARVRPLAVVSLPGELGWPSGLGCRLKQGDNGSCFKRLLKSPASICKVLAQCEMREADTC